jgi:hypothetical protein
VSQVLQWGTWTKGEEKGGKKRKPFVDAAPFDDRLSLCSIHHLIKSRVLVRIEGMDVL